MKFLKFRYILTLLIVAVLGISLLVYFLGGLKAKALDSNNLEFDLTGYKDYSDFDNKGFNTVNYNSLEELNAAIEGLDPSSYVKTIDEASETYTVVYELNRSLIVAQNEKYTMFLDENTTIVSVVVNDTCDAPTGKTGAGFDNIDKSSCETVYSTALDSFDASNEQKSNFILYYVGSNGKENTLGFNTYANSVLYKDQLLNQERRYYKIKFDIEDGIQILYEIGDFNVINSFFPQKFNREDLFNYFRGNLVFLSKPSNKFEYLDIAYTWDSECAAYVEENELGTVTPKYDKKGKVDEEGNQIPARWEITNILAKDEEDRTLNKLKMEAGVDYNASDFNAEGASPCIANPFLNYTLLDKLFIDYYKASSKDQNDETITYSTDWKLNLENSQPTYDLNASGLQFEYLNELLYKKHSDKDPNYYYTDITTKAPALYDENPYDDIEGVPMIMGGYQARDEEGNFVYNDDGTPVQEVFDKQKANYQNELHGVNVEMNNPVFQVGMRFVLTENGLETTILNESLKEGLGKDYLDEDGNSTMYSHDLVMSSITVLPYFTSNASDTSEGQIVLPDGSGAIMNFNSPKEELGYNAYQKPIYGADKAFTFDKAPQTRDNETYMLSMYGFLDKTNEKGVLAIADKGASQTSIYANFRRSTGNVMNIAYFKALLRESETVYAGTAETPFLKWAKGYADTDLKYLYHFLDSDEFITEDDKVQYVGLAQKYREYLIDKYNLVELDDTKENVLALNFLGAYEKREVTLGFAHNKDYSLTNFDQAEQIIKELQAEGINNFSVSYTAWTNDAMEPKATDRVKVSKVLGSTKGIKSFYSFLQDNNINFYPDSKIATNKGYDYLFGDLKYTAKSIGSTYSKHRPYVLATNMSNSTVKPTTYVSPRFYDALISKYMNSYDNFSIKGAYMSDLGNFRTGDYSRKVEMYAEKGMEYQIDALTYAKEQVDNILLTAPNDYALQFANFAVDIPLESTLLGYYDYTIPFYQLVISGLIDYTGPAVNNDSEHSSNWYLLKSLETGSNLYFMLSYEDTKALLDTDYTMYYNAYYLNWKSEIIRMNDIINSTNIHNGRLINHEILKDNVYKVEYSNGTVLVINYNNSIYSDEAIGLSVRPNWFTVLEEGL